MAATPVFIGLDVEDAFNPEADDALKRLCEVHTDVGVPLNLFVAGQKARVLRRNCRHDVIAALGEHEICYHGNYWFDYPEPAMLYGARDDWDTALAKAYTIEIEGLNEVAQVTGRFPAAYVQHQGNHSPVTQYAVRQAGVMVNNGGFGDDMPHNAWVMDTLFVGRASRNVGYQGDWSQMWNPLKPERQKPAVDPDVQLRNFQEAFDRQLEKGHDHVNILGHPTCWHFAEWWGWYDFILPFRQTEEKGGPGPFPHDRLWRKPVQRTQADIDAHFEWTRRAAEWLAGRDDVQVMKLSDYYEQHREPAGQWLSIEQVRDMARRLTESFDALKVGETTVSAADALVLLATLGEHVIHYNKLPRKLQIRRTIGPAEPVPEIDEPMTVPREEYLMAARGIYSYVMTHGRIPHEVKTHRINCGPAQALMALAQAFSGDELPDEVTVAPVSGLPEAANLPVFKNAKANSTNAPPFYEDRLGKRMNMLCKLQSWSYRPLVKNA